MIDFPVPSAPGQEFTAAGITYIWNGQGWQVKGSTAAGTSAADITFFPFGNIEANNVQGALLELDNEKVAKAGDTMTGLLTLSGPPTADLHAATKLYVDTTGGGGGGGSELHVLKSGDTMTGHLVLPTGPAASNAVRKDYVDTAVAAGVGATPSNATPLMDGTAAAGTSALFARGDHRHPTDTSLATSAFVIAQDALRVNKVGDVMTGNLTINSATPTLVLSKTAATQYNAIYGSTNGSLRWFISPGNSANETGGNAGSNFDIYRYDDTGGYLGTPFSLNRATALMTCGPINSGSINCGAITATSVYAPSGFITTAAVHPGYGTTAVGIEIGSDFMFVSRASSAAFFNINTSGTNVAFSYAGGQVGSISNLPGGTAYNTTSDARLKEDLKTFDAGNVIDNTNVYDFAWKDTKTRAYGVIAQEAVNVYPNAISYDEAADWWGVDYGKYMPVVLQEMKALRARVAELEVLAGTRPAPPDPKTHG